MASVESAQSPHSRAAETKEARPRVALFVTCLVDLFRPSVGFSAVTLLEQAGCDVTVPTSQTCCGQPAYNSGDKQTTADIARQTVAALEGFDYVVAPSGSCAGMIRKHYPELLVEDPEWWPRAQAIASRTHELISFLVDKRGMTSVDAKVDAVATYHDSCSGLRELKIKDQPRTLLNTVEGLTLVEMEDSEVCCGFGGLFSVKYPDISNEMVAKKTANAETVQPDMLLAGDLGCLMNMAGKIRRNGKPIAVRHVAEVLAGELDAPPIAEKS